jgi:hypothetical protein
MAQKAWATMSKKGSKGLVSEAKTFEYTAQNLKDYDAKCKNSSETISLRVMENGELHCAQPSCQKKDFGKTTFTRAEFYVVKHLVAFHAELLPDPSKKAKVMLLRCVH